MKTATFGVWRSIVQVGRQKIILKSQQDLDDRCMRASRHISQARLHLLAKKIDDEVKQVAA